MFDEMSLLTDMVSHSINDNMLFICVSAKDYGYRFFNLNSHNEMVEFATHLSYIQLNTDIADVFICTDNEKTMIENSEIKKAINSDNEWWHCNA